MQKINFKQITVIFIIFLLCGCQTGLRKDGYKVWLSNELFDVRIKQVEAKKMKAEMELLLLTKKDNVKAQNKKIKQIEAIVFKFETKKSEVTPGHQLDIDKLDTYLRELIASCNNPNDIILIIEGFTDGVGSTYDNFTLSRLRANGIAEAILAKTKLPFKMFQIDLFGENRITKVLNNSSDEQERIVRLRIKTVDDVPLLAFNNLDNRIKILGLELELLEARIEYALSKYR